jgi:membrane-associated phospholipid phosphatase
MQGMDSSLFSMPNYPTLTSDWMGAEILEVYLMMCCRDVKFDEYGTGEGTDNDGNGGSITAQAAAVLNSLGDAYHGPRNSDGIVDASVLFRGMTAGDQVGPYVSQFLLQKLYPLFPAGCAGFVATLIGVQNLNQNIISTKQLYPIAEKREFGVSWEDFIAIQNGFIPKLYAVTDYNQTHLRYIITGRDIASLDHADTPFGYYTNVLIILAHAGFPINPNFPYANGTITRESAGFDMGAPDAFTLVGGVCSEAFKAAWAQKWRTFRRARPEAICGLVNYAKINNVNPYSLSPIIFETHAGVDVLAWALAHNQLQALAEYDPQQLLTLEEASTYLLAQVFPEGSPTHPAYPSGHSVVAGACTTVIKAIFNDLTPLKPLLTPVIVDPLDPENLIPLTDGSEDLMTVGSELDKLASNVANGRDIAGVHWRSDGDAGLLLGEYVAICYLQDQARKYPEAGFTGFRLTKRDGTRILITANSVTTIG